MYKCILIFFVLSSCKSTVNSQITERFYDEETELWGLKKGSEIVVPPTYISISPFTKCGIAPTAHPYDGFFYIDRQGKKLDVPVLIIEATHEPFREGLARFRRNNKIGFINECGEIVIPAIFEDATYFKNGFAIVHKGFKILEKGPYKIPVGGKKGVINKKGELVIPYKFDRISMFSVDKTAFAKIKDKPVTINSKGEIID